MGTNFYSLKGTHLGKRSCAGPYCWDCGRTLCKHGEQYVHNTYLESHGTFNRTEVEWLDHCPACGKKAPKPKDLFSGAAGRELGFNKDPYAPKTGIASCSSFGWAIEERKAFALKFVKDEYEQKFTIKEFKEILTECPIRFYRHIGQEFS